MRLNLKIITISLLVGALAITLYRYGFFAESNNNKHIVDVLFPAPVRFNLIVIGLFGPIVVLWIFLSRKMKRKK
jgi:hypothetical protein